MDGKCWNLFQFLIFSPFSESDSNWIFTTLNENKLDDVKRIIICLAKFHIDTREGFISRWKIWFLCRRYNNKNYMWSQDLWMWTGRMCGENNHQHKNIFPHFTILFQRFGLDFAKYPNLMHKSHCSLNSDFYNFHLSMMASWTIFSRSIFGLESFIIAHFSHLIHKFPFKSTTIYKHFNDKNKSSNKNKILKGFLYVQRHCCFQDIRGLKF